MIVLAGFSRLQYATLERQNVRNLVGFTPEMSRSSEKTVRWKSWNMYDSTDSDGSLRVIVTHIAYEKTVKESSVKFTYYDSFLRSEIPKLRILPMA